MRGALVVGIDHYEHFEPLSGCVYDAQRVEQVLSRHGDGSINCDVLVLSGTGPQNVVTAQLLRESIRRLFENDLDLAVFYFAGHGHLDLRSGYLIAGDSRHGADGVSLSEVMVLANDSTARDRVIILDSCHSGIAGSHPGGRNRSDLTEGVTILASSGQPSEEQYGGGLFTARLVDALEGAAANLLGEITAARIYEHISQPLAWWSQRPVFKANVASSACLRKVPPPVPVNELREIPKFFTSANYLFPLDPCYEPEGPCPDPEKTHIFAILQKLNRVNLVVPVDAPHMWHAAMGSKWCKLTPLGEHYRHLVKIRRI